ncbi:hypothetical protein OBV_29990 [Oscillibacter valericigenes Sjm18-20]|nr:hypothetical protein OBV_29990 [Oscillibacter valericigenes Sjm18-20]
MRVTGFSAALRIALSLLFLGELFISWYEYFSTDKPEHFFALMQTLPSSNPAPQ